MPFEVVHLLLEKETQNEFSKSSHHLFAGVILGEQEPLVETVRSVMVPVEQLALLAGSHGKR